MKMAWRRRSNCPISFALDIFGDRWSLLIIRDMMFGRKTTYGEFLESDEKISTNILADRLHRLEAAGIIRKESNVKDRRKIEYRLTEKGLRLEPVLQAMALWSAAHNRDTPVPKKYLGSVLK
jgi:DNA-binding HxlR family transcriptional regulator